MRALQTSPVRAKKDMDDRPNWSIILSALVYISNRRRPPSGCKATVGWAPYVTKDYVWIRYYAYFMIFDLIVRRFYSIVRKGVELARTWSVLVSPSYDSYIHTIVRSNSHRANAGQEAVLAQLGAASTASKPTQ
jgi:hypothetical protein